MRVWAPTPAFALALLLLAGWASAAFDPPHGSNCANCHTAHGQAAGAIDTASGNANLCLSCHSPAGTAADLALGWGDRADPFEAHTGASHSWQTGVERAEAGALPPQTPEMAARTPDGQIICSTCHNQHDQTHPPHLRVSNAGDALCLDCHRPRDLGRYTDNPAVNIGSHPVRLPIPAGHAGFREPGDGDPHLPMPDGIVVCSTCHRVHRAPSRQTRQHRATGGTTQSATVAGAGWAPDAFAGWEIVFPSTRQWRTVAGNTPDTVRWVEPLSAAVEAAELFVLQAPGEGDGTLLRAPNGDGLCQTCHTYPDHPRVDPAGSCRTCHVPHGTDNVLLVAPEIGGQAVEFSGRAGSDFVHGAPNFDGVCETCHTQTRYHRNSAAGDHTHHAGQQCTICHHHDVGFGSPCVACHESSPTRLATGSHPTHLRGANGPHLSDCGVCHGAGASQGMHAGHLNGVVNFSGGASDTIATTAVCDDCHSPAGFVDGVAEAKGAWATGVYATPGRLEAAHARWCAGCHDDDPSTTGVNESSQIEGAYAPAMLGDNVTHGHYVTGHGREGPDFPPMSWQAPTATGNPAAAVQCDECHDATSPHIGAGETDRLPPGFGGDQVNAGCAVCHESGGPGANGPVYFVSAADYGGSAHGGLRCTACHNPHGTAGPAPAMATGIEETLCYTCHTGVQAEFGGASRHDVYDGEQIVHGSRVECTMCHNPHMASAAEPLVDPDDVTARWTAASPREFCLACHDGAPPAAALFPVAPQGTGYNQAAFRSSRHDVTLGGDCTLCHSAHGTDNRSTLRAAYTVADNTALSEAAYQLCFDCHSYSLTVQQANAFASRHSQHAGSFRAPCIACHNAHAPVDAGESGLIDFRYAVARGYFTITGQTASTAFRDTGVDRGSCSLRCHGEGHDPESYRGTARETVDCLQCHATHP